MQQTKAMRDYIQQFKCDVTKMQPVIDNMLYQMELGLKGKCQSLNMIRSYTDVPSGNESGYYLAIDFGGTNLRCLLVNLFHNKVVNKIEKSTILDATTESSEVLFSTIADFIVTFLNEHKEQLPPKEEGLDVGFTFSFPCRQTDISSGKLIRWTKEFRANDALNKDVVELLTHQLRKKGCDWIHISALCNDTVGTLCAAAVDYPDTLVGVILGTGANACYVEALRNIPKLGEGHEKRQGSMIINMEWGGFDGFPTTPDDDAVHQGTRRQGQQRLEKMMSGKYLPMLCRQALRRCFENGWVLGSLDFDAYSWDERQSLQGIMLAKIQYDDTPTLTITRKFILDLFPDRVKSDPLFEEAYKDDIGGVFPLRELQLVRSLFSAIVKRAADYMAVAIAAVVVRIVNNLRVPPTFSVAIDGSIFHKYKGFKEMLTTGLDLCLGSLTDLMGGISPAVKIVSAHDGSGLGAAIIAAVQSEHKRKSHL